MSDGGSAIGAGFVLPRRYERIACRGAAVKLGKTAQDHQVMDLQIIAMLCEYDALGHFKGLSSDIRCD